VSEGVGVSHDRVDRQGFSGFVVEPREVEEYHVFSHLYQQLLPDLLAHVRQRGHVLRCWVIGNNPELLAYWQIYRCLTTPLIEKQREHLLQSRQHVLDTFLVAAPSPAPDSGARHESEEVATLKNTQNINLFDPFGTQYFNCEGV
jgi:hypothetical protein